MANELDKTIEELEAEVLDELEEANGNAPKPNATATDPMDKLDSDGATGATETIPGSTPDKVAPHKGADASKGAKTDTSIPKKGKADKMDTAKDAGQNRPLAASYDPTLEGFSDNEIRELCHSKDHDCATMVEHPQWGKGKPILRSHAIPDDNGHVEWYDVQFKHGIEEKVMAEDMRIVFSEAHHEDMDMPKTKDALMAAMHKEMKHMKKDQLQAAYGSMIKAMAHGDKEESAEVKEKKEAVENRLKSIDVSEHVNALVDGEGDLSEDFKKKAATVFEAAVKSKVRDEVTRLEDEYKSELNESIKSTKEGLTEKVDNYLNYVVEEWMKENELAIERGLKGEIAEDFISGLKQLFEDHYVDVPDEKYDVLEAQSEKITELEGKLDEAITNIVSLRQDKTSLIKEKAISESTVDLADTEIEKFKSLTGDVEFTDENSFKEKLDTLKESYFPRQKSATETEPVINDEEAGNAQDVDTTGSMNSYMRAIGKFGNGAK